MPRPVGMNNLINAPSRSLTMRRGMRLMPVLYLAIRTAIPVNRYCRPANPIAPAPTGDAR